MVFINLIAHGLGQLNFLALKSCVLWVENYYSFVLELFVDFKRILVLFLNTKINKNSEIKYIYSKSIKQTLNKESKTSDQNPSLNH